MVLALLGASAGLAGLVLVFLGLVLNAYAGLDNPVPKGTKRPYRQVGGGLLAAFAIGLACVVVAATWLTELQDNHTLYLATVYLFFVQIAALVGTTAWTSKELLWD